MSQQSQDVRDPAHCIPLTVRQYYCGGGAIESNGDSALTAQLDDSAKARDLPQPSAALAVQRPPEVSILEPPINWAT